MKDRLKVVILGLVLFFCCSFVFHKLAQRWFNATEIGKTGILKQRFWKSLAIIIVFVVFIIVIQYLYLKADFTPKHWFQIAGVIIALTGALSRGGWGIQTWSGETIAEKIDRGMYVISQLGATGILLFVLIL